MKRRKFLKLIGRIIVLCIVGIIIGLGIYNINAKKVLGNEMPMPFGVGVSIVLSGSMEPELSVDDLIIVKKTDTLYVGQVIVYESHGSLVVHRIETINDNEIITKGDANNIADDPITKDVIKGEVVYSVPKIGKIVYFLKNPIVIFCILGLLLLGLEYSYRKEKQKDQDELKKLKDDIKNILDETKNK